MKAVCWHGRHDVRVDTVPDPTIINPHDAIVRVSSTAICGSDLHIYNGWLPGMRRGDILGHEFMGDVVAIGSACEQLAVGDRVIVMCAVACGRCWFCKHEQFAGCDNSNPASAQTILEIAYGHAGAAVYGHSHLYGGYSGGQAEYVRVPFADVGCLRVPQELSDEQVLLLTDILPTAYQAVESCNLQRGDAVAVFGAGAVGQLAIKTAITLGAERVIAVDSVPERLKMAAEQGAIVVDETHGDVLARLAELTGGRGPDACIDAVGREAHGSGYDTVKQTLRMETDRPAALRKAIFACRKGGTVAIAGAYAGVVDKFPIGAAFVKGLKLTFGQTHFHRYARPLLERVLARDIDPSFVITHRVTLDDIPAAYAMFDARSDGCVKVVARVR